MRIQFKLKTVRFNRPNVLPFISKTMSCKFIVASLADRRLAH